MKLIAPNFKTADPSGKDFELYRELRKRAVLLVFYRGYWCDHCREQLSEINEHLGDFKRLAINVVAVSADRPLEASLIINFLGLAFPVIPDPDWKIFGLYGFTRPENQKEILPAVFLIGKDKKIVYSYIGKDYRDRPPIETLINKASKHTALRA
jgi:peroxiredoxin